MNERFRKFLAEKSVLVGSLATIFSLVVTSCAGVDTKPYIASLFACMDKNGNEVCEADEPAITMRLMHIQFSSGESIDGKTDGFGVMNKSLNVPAGTHLSKPAIFVMDKQGNAITTCSVKNSPDLYTTETATIVSIKAACAVASK